MHELALAQRTIELMAETAAANGGGRIVSARLLVGELSSVQAEALAFGFEAASRGTRAEGCRLDIVRVPAKLRCRECGATRGGDPPSLAVGELRRDPAEARRAEADLLEACPACGHVGCDVLEGTELRLESVDLEECKAASETAKTSRRQEE